MAKQTVLYTDGSGNKLVFNDSEDAKASYRYSLDILEARSESRKEKVGMWLEPQLQNSGRIYRSTQKIVEAIKRGANQDTINTKVANLLKALISNQGYSGIKIARMTGDMMANRANVEAALPVVQTARDSVAEKRKKRKSVAAALDKRAAEVQTSGMQAEPSSSEATASSPAEGKADHRQSQAAAPAGLTPSEDGIDLGIMEELTPEATALSTPKATLSPTGKEAFLSLTETDGIDLGVMERLDPADAEVLSSKIKEDDAILSQILAALDALIEAIKSVLSIRQSEAEVRVAPQHPVISSRHSFTGNMSNSAAARPPEIAIEEEEEYSNDSEKEEKATHRSVADFS